LASKSKCLAQGDKPATRAKVYTPRPIKRGDGVPVVQRLECPSCHALYKVVRASFGTGQAINCKVCKRPLAPEQKGEIVECVLIRRSPNARRPR
jgi:hypothetical protein